VTVYLLGAGPGDPGLLTRRAAAVLARADVVLHDRLVAPAVLHLVRPGALVLDVGKESEGGGRAASGGTGSEQRQVEIERQLVAYGRSAEVVVRLKGGDPFVFGRGGEEVEALEAAGVPWEVVPGVTSAFGVPGAVGIPVTQRGLASSVTVVTGRVGAAGEGATRDTASDNAPDWEALAHTGGTLVILMGMSTRAAIAEELVRAGKDASTPVAVLAQGTMPGERVVRTTLAGLAAVDLPAPAVIVVGPVAALGRDASRWGGAGPGGGQLAGRTVALTRAGPHAQRLVDALADEGATTVELALTAQVDAADGGAALRAAASDVQANEWVVLTSAHAVERLLGALRDARALGTVLVAAVGPATADALRRRGVEPDLVPDQHSARGLVAAFPAAPEPGARVLFPAADRAAATLESGLGAKGWDVRRVEAYRTVASGVPDDTLLERTARADALVVTAPSAVQAFAALRTPAGEPLRVPRHVVCIGPSTAAAAHAAGWDGVREAAEASPASLVRALAEVLGPSGSARPAP
jgi:uroporphyrinogen III methyltransferase / synthase